MQDYLLKPDTDTLEKDIARMAAESSFSFNGIAKAKFIREQTSTFTIRAHQMERHLPSI